LGQHLCFSAHLQPGGISSTVTLPNNTLHHASIADGAWTLLLLQCHCVQFLHSQQLLPAGCFACRAQNIMSYSNLNSHWQSYNNCNAKQPHTPVVPIGTLRAPHCLPTGRGPGPSALALSWALWYSSESSCNTHHRFVVWYSTPLVAVSGWCSPRLVIFSD
jgi:hypothetical protein